MIHCRPPQPPDKPYPEWIWCLHCKEFVRRYTGCHHLTDVGNDIRKKFNKRMREDETVKKKRKEEGNDRQEGLF